MKLLLTVLVLIVLPTAWLSLLAGRSIQARELLLDRRLEAEAQQTLEQIGTEITHAVDGVLDRLAVVVGGTVLGGDDIRLLDVAVRDLAFADRLFAQVYLYMHPWGFIHPESANPEHAQLSDIYILLSQQLSQRLSRGDQRLVFAVGAHMYAFGSVPGEPNLYVGYEVLPDGLLALLERKLTAHSTAHIEYRLLRVGPVFGTEVLPAASGLEIRDTLSVETEHVPLPVDFMRDTRRRDVLVSGRLRAPFDFVEIGAVAVNARDMYAARALQARLVWWSILLLAFVLLSSAVILIVMGRRQAEQARMRSIFIAGLSHDIRTPVTAMRALAESLQQGRVSTEERKQQFFDSIVGECDRLQMLIERVLLFFRQEQGGYYQKRPIELVPLCERVGDAFCGRHRGRVQLTMDVPQDVVPTMWADGAALEQALHNILENAWKYGRPSPDHPDQVIPIRLRLTVANGGIWRRCLHLAVEDAGPGVPVREQQRIFARFYRGGCGAVQQSGGIGLGLALVWEIVRGHGGRVFVERSTMGGARFVMQFKPYPLCGRSWRQYLHGLGVGKSA